MSLPELEEILGHRFRRPDLLETALQHPSFSRERDGTAGNERLEFLGDAVLDLAVARLLYEAHPDWSEGDLTRTRAGLVNTRALAQAARGLGIERWLRLGRTERRTGGGQKESILANTLEAVIGALYLDGARPAVEELARQLCGGALDPASLPRPPDPKTGLQEWAHARGHAAPIYRLVGDSGVENDDARYEVEVRVAGRARGRGRGRTKRAAEREAARAALQGIEPAAVKTPNS